MLDFNRDFDYFILRMCITHMSATASGVRGLRTLQEFPVD